MSRSRRTAGSEAQTVGSEAQTVGSEPQTTGSEPQTAGSEPQTAGSEPQTTGSEGPLAFVGAVHRMPSGTLPPWVEEGPAWANAGKHLRHKHPTLGLRIIRL